MAEPDFVVKPGSDIEALLQSEHIKNPYPYPGDIDLQSSYSSEPPESAHSINLRKQAKHTLANAWKYDPIKCSVKAAFQADRDLVETPKHGLTKEEYSWVTGAKLKTVKKARSAIQVDFEQGRKLHEWIKELDEDDELLSLKGTNLDQDLDEFYGPDGIDIRPIDNGSDVDVIRKPNAIATTTFTTFILPDNSHMEEGVIPGGIFQDSCISIEKGYAEYSLAHALANTAAGIAAAVPSNRPKFIADIAPLGHPEKKGRWLGLVGDQKQCDWPGRRQGPYDLHDLRFAGASSKSDHLELLEEPEASFSEPHDMAGPFTQQPDLREAVASRNVEASVGQDRETPSAHMTAASAVAEGPDADQMVDAPNVDTIHEVTSPVELVEHAQEISEPVVGKIHDKPSETGSDDDTSVSAPYMTRGSPQIDTDADIHARRSIPTTAFLSPVSQRIRQIQQVQVDNPATPATANINPTPEYDSDMDAEDSSDGSLEVRLPNSPTTNTQKGQSALGRYVQETTSHPDIARQSSSTISLDGSESEDVWLIPTPARPSKPEGHAGFSRGVELHQKKSNAVFTLSPPGGSQGALSSSKTGPIPVTPALENESSSFHPSTPFQLGTPAPPDFDSPGTPTPVPKLSKANGKSVMNIFSSSELGSRSPERAKPSPKIVALTTAPAVQHPGSSFGSQGLLFHKAKKNERDTKNVLNSLKLSPERGSGGSESEAQDNYEDELAGEKAVEVYNGGKWVNETPSMIGARVDLGAHGGRKVAQAVVVPSVRSRNESEGMHSEDVQSEQPQKKKLRRSMRAAGGADVPDVTPLFER